MVCRLIDLALAAQTLNLSFYVPLCVCHNTDLPTDSNVTKMVRGNIALDEHFLKNIQQAF